jgi:hypothetical protein
MLELKPDRIMIYYNGTDGDWISLRVACFHYTIFKTDILDLLGILDIDMPAWLETVLDRAQNAESRPIPAAPFPQSLPSLATIRNLIPSVIEPGMAFPTWSGTQIAGLVINPGGDVQITEIPFRANLRTGSFLGLNTWLQSGMLNGAACLVSQSIIYYQRATQSPLQYPLLDITGYIPGQMGYGATIWHVPGLQDTDSHATEAGWAHNEIAYIGGHYDVHRNYYTDCPVPDYPNGHFMRPYPGAKMTITTNRGTLGRQRLWLQDDYVDGDDLSLVPFGCLPGWPTNEYLAQYGLYNNDDVNLNSLSDIVALPSNGYVWQHANTELDGYGQVIWQETPQSGVILGQLPSILSGLGVVWRYLDIRAQLTRDAIRRTRITLDGEDISLAGNYLEV